MKAVVETETEIHVIRVVGTTLTMIMTARMTLARDMEDFVGKYYSKEWFRTNILRQNEQEAQLEDERIEGELESESDGSEDEGI